MHVIRTSSANGDLTVRRRRRDGKCRRFDPVWNHFMLRTREFLDACNRNRRAARAHNLRAHLAQEKGQIHDFRLARGAFNRRHALGQHSRHHDVRRPEHRRTRTTAEKNIRTNQTPGLGVHIAGFDGNLGSEIPHPLQMKINGASPDDTATRQRNSRMTLAPQQRTEDANRPAHLADEIVIPDRIQLGGADRHRIAVHFDLRSE